MISNVGASFAGDGDELLRIWGGEGGVVVVMDIQVEESPTYTWCLKPSKAMGLFRGSKWAEIDSRATNLKGRKWKRFREVSRVRENQENRLTRRLRESRLLKGVASN